MSQTLFSFTIETESKQEFIRLDHYTNHVIEKSRITNGAIICYCPHTTAAVTINENADPDVKTDLKKGLDTTFPNSDDYIHYEGNSDGHMKASMMGASETIIVNEGQPILGTWQSLYFVDFDGPRTRTLYYKVLKED